MTRLTSVQRHIQAFAAEFSLDDEIIHLNHAAVGPWPTRTVDTIKHFAEENLRLGSKHYLRWLEQETSLRHQIASLINAASHESIALVKNTSEALSFVAYGLEWKSGDNVVITNAEFPFNHVVWESLANQGVELRIADTRPGSGQDPEASILEQCNEKTRLVSVSSIQYSTGLKLDLNILGEFCKQRNILFCIDSIQSVGAVPFDVQASQADFAMADGHKWMLAPEGLGFFYCRADIMHKIKLREFGWHMLENMGGYNDKSWEPAHTARRFECGSPNLLCVHALSASLSLLLDAGMDAVYAALRDNVQFMLDLIESDDRLELHSPASADRLGGIVVFSHREKNTDSLYRHLQKNNVLCAPRGAGIRFSPHFYTPRERIQKAFEIVLG